MTDVICMWSGPRNLSTAMMRSFENRPDCAVWDEPFFAPFLKVTGLPHPGREESLIAHETDASVVAKLCLEPPPSSPPYYFQKHMPHHMRRGFDRDWMRSCKHFFLLRDPAMVINSYAKGRPDFDIDDIGFLSQVKLYDEICSWAGCPPPIIDSNDILRNPEAALTALCHALGIPFDNAMLNWPAGPRDSDGAWAPYWYKSVENSIGFGAPRAETPQIPARYQHLLEQCRPAFERLYALRLSTI